MTRTDLPVHNQPRAKEFANSLPRPPFPRFFARWLGLDLREIRTVFPLYPLPELAIASNSRTRDNREEMRHAPVRGFVALAFSSFLICPAAGAESFSCPERLLVTTLDSRLGTSSLFSNLFATRDSIKRQFRSMLSDAEQSASIAPLPPALQCPEGCSPSPEPLIEFAAVPRNVRTDSADHLLCLERLAQTSALPITYHWADLTNFDEFADAFSDLARGSGPDGEDLYRRCEGECSPRYDLLVSRVTAPNGEFHYTGEMRIICGLPRDREDSFYQLETKFTWGCRRL